MQARMEKSFAGAQAVAQRYPQYAGKITAAAKSAFLAGDRWAYLTGILAVLPGAPIVLFLPAKQHKEHLLAVYQAQDIAGQGPGEPDPGPGTAA
jgi:hypothetical protein